VSANYAPVHEEELRTTGDNFVFVLVSVAVVVRVLVLLTSMTCGLAAALPARMRATRA